MTRSLLARPLNGDKNFSPGASPETMVDNPGEVASPGRFPVYMGNDITDPNPCKVGWTACHQLAYQNPAVGKRYAVNADSAEFPGGTGGKGGEGEQ